ncbi:MAG: hypothetical protein QOI24_1324 [Acidobacteriota bacterium]|jgi:hypothetical protein|nr:hypothetical protein [Acidobacteriota bacterium]
MLTLLRVAPFALLLLLGAITVATKWRRGATSTFIAFFLTASCVAGFAQRDLWPFSPYPVIAETAERWRESVWYEARAVDAHGVEHPLDVSPFTRSVYERSLTRGLPMIEPMVREHQPTRNDRLLRALAAPDWLLTRGRLTDDEQAVRIYRHDVRGTKLVSEIPSR